MQAAVSLKRMNKFMNADELNPCNVLHDPTESELSFGDFSVELYYNSIVIAVGFQ